MRCVGRKFQDIETESLGGGGSGPPHCSGLAGSSRSSWDFKDCKATWLPSGENARDKNGDLVPSWPHRKQNSVLMDESYRMSYR